MDPIPDQLRPLILNLRGNAILMRDMELMLEPHDVLKLARIGSLIEHIDNLPSDVNIQHLFAIYDYLHALSNSVRYNM